LKERADFTTVKDHGAGVTELIDLILRDDLQSMEARLVRHKITLGVGRDDKEIQTAAQR